LPFEHAQQGSRNRREQLRAAVPDDRYSGLDYYKSRTASTARAASKANTSHKSSKAQTAQAAGVRVKATRGRAQNTKSHAQSVKTNTQATKANAQAANTRAQMREQAKRSRAKAKASKAFDKQYASSTTTAAADAGPRAAVYKGHMVSNQRRAARMQTQDHKQRASFGFSPVNLLSWFASKFAHANIALVATVALCSVFAVGFLYPTARTYYQGVREEARLELEYSMLLDRNQALSSSVDYLQTDAGIEARARSQYGLVMAGEASGVVAGVDSSADSASIEAKVLSDNVKAPATWYSPILDPLFGVES
jgi:cell division protein FtsB